MIRILGCLLLAMPLCACATAPQPGAPIGLASACRAMPLEFTVSDQRALHACPFVRGDTQMAFAVVEGGVVSAVVDEGGARDWVKAARCSLPGLAASDAVTADTVCTQLVSDLFGLWRTAEKAEARAQRAEAALLRTRLQAKTWRSSDPFVGDSWGW